MDIKRIFELTNPLLKVRYHTGEEGPIRRCDIVQPPVPRRLEKDQEVTTMYEGQEYMASMLEPWNEPVVLALTGVDTKLTVLYYIDRSISRVLRSDIPFPPADIALYSRVQARFKGKFLDGTALQSWRPGRAKVSVVVNVVSMISVS